jgi:hypothetical protein
MAAVYRAVISRAIAGAAGAGTDVVYAWRVSARHVRPVVLGVPFVLLVAACGGGEAPGAPPDQGLPPGDTAGTLDTGGFDTRSTDGGGPADGSGDAPGTPDAADAGGPPPDGAPPPPDAPPPPPSTPALYPDGITQSPLTPAVVANLQRIAAASADRQANVFAKIGDSQTVNTAFLTCLDGQSVNLDMYADLDGTRTFFAAGDAAGSSPYDRVTLAATVGWSASSAVAGDPSPVAQEVAAINPRYAVVMFGTNDVEARSIFNYASSMGLLADTLIGDGIIPILTSVPPRDDSATADANVPRYNAVARALAQARQVPFIDLHREVLPLPSHGLGPDGVHLNVYSTSAGTRGCVFDSAGLEYGNNVRNLLTLEALDRTRAAVEQGTAPDASAPALQGQGTPDSPYLMDAFPFGDARDTSTDGQSLINSYPGCSATQDESGNEVYYRLEVTRTTTVHAWVFVDGSVDIDLHLTGATPDGQSCIQRNDKEIVATLDPGTYHFVLDTYVSNGTVHSGPYLFVAVTE